MKRGLILGLAFTLSTLVAIAQQKVKDGTVATGSLPNKDAILELESNKKGFLHARVALKASTDSFPLGEHVAGMMVYNTATSADVVPGIYYNDGTKWIISSRGADGKSITSGNGAPVINAGKNGDTYVDAITGDVYIKQGDIWTVTGNIKGQKGDAGVVGVQGLPGTSGTPGKPGSGTTGAPGAGVTIVTNDSGTWVYNPTTNTWTNINGPKGDKGDAGVVGVQGLPGTSGTPGKPGSGTLGAPGEGITIVNNDSGTWVYNPTTNTWTNINGKDGKDGKDGAPGAVGLPGTGAPGKPGSGEPGAPGEGITIVNNDSGTWVYNKTTNTWSNINGKDGKDGAPGAVGLPGTSGTPGKPGSGEQGAPGDGVTIVNNDSGTWVYNTTTNTWSNINGKDGKDGAPGAVGLPGTSGTPGKPGSGEQGAPGDGVTIVNNDSGTWVYNTTTNTWSNINGKDGKDGAPGAVGLPGTSGTPGKPGSGEQGAPGDGVTIVNNDSGTWVYNTTTNTWSNINGKDGKDGAPGAVGLPGTSGTPGKPGSGEQGAPGDGVTIVNNDSGTWVYNTTTNTWSNINGKDGKDGAPGAVGLPGTSGTPGKPGSGEQGAPGDGVTIVNNDSGTWVYNTTTNTWSNINGKDGKDGAPGAVGLPGTSGTPGKPGSGEQGAPGDGVTIVNNDSGTWVYNTTTNTWSNINGKDGKDGAPGAVGLPGTSGTPGKPGSGEQGAPGDGVTIVNNDSGTWVYNTTTNTWSNINGKDGKDGAPGAVGLPGTSGTPGKPGSGEQGAPGDGVTIVNNDSGTWVYNTTTNTWSNINGKDGGIGSIVDGTNTTVTGDGILVPYKINTPTSTFIQEVATGNITHKNEEGKVGTAKIKSEDALNILKIGTDGGLILTSIDIPEPLQIQGTTNKATANTDNVYQMGTVAIGKNAVQKGAILDVQGAIRGGNTPKTGDIGANSIAVGDNLIVFGVNSAAFGSGNTVMGNNSFSMGVNNTFERMGGDYSGSALFGIGNMLLTEGGGPQFQNNTIFGTLNSINTKGAGGSTQNNTIFGQNNTIIGSGRDNKNSTVFGNNNLVSSRASNSTVFGEFNISNTYNQFIIGKANENVDNSLFEIGIGANAASRANAVTVISTGEVGINTIDPTNKLHVAATVNPVRFEGLQTGAKTDNIVVADATGVLKTVKRADLVGLTTNTLVAPNGNLVSTVNGVATTPAVAVLINANNGLTPNNGVVKLGGALDPGTTTITTAGTTNQLAIAGLAVGTTADKIVVADATTGVLKAVTQIPVDLRVVGNSNHITQDAGVGGTGTSVGTGSENIAIGRSVLNSNVSGEMNTAVGTDALYFNTVGGANTAIGHQALVANTTGNRNTAVGLSALADNTTGDRIVSIGAQSLQHNTTGVSNVAVGYLTGNVNSTGEQNTFLGSGADVVVDGLKKATAVGYRAKVGASNSLVLGGTGVDAVKVGIGTTIPLESLDVAVGGVKINAVNTAPYLGNVATDNIVVADATGVLKTVKRADLLGATTNANNGLGVTAGVVQLGGALIKPTTITTDGNALSIVGLPTGAVADKVVVADANGVLKQVKSAMPKFFYMPSMSLETETIGQTYTVNLYNEYKTQFTNIPANQRSSATADIPFIPTAAELDFYVTYFDNTVIDLISVQADGTMTYKVISAAKTASFVNIVFVVK